MSKVSVIILTYNRARYLRRAVRSVLSQTYQDFEVVVVDDASTDETPEVVRGFQDPRIRYFRHDTNRGESGSRNTGIQYSVGEYVAFLDDDDAWLPQKLAMQVKLLDTSPIEVGAVYTSFFEIEADTEKVLGSWIAQKRGNVLRELTQQNWIGVPSTVVLRRRCFDSVGLFDEQIVFGPDYDMWIRIAEHYKFEYIKEPLALRSVNNNRMSTNHALVLKGKESILKKHADFLSLDRKAYGSHLFHLGVFYCYNGQMRAGRATLLQAIRIDPFDMRTYYNIALSLLGAGKFKKVKTFRDRIASW
jgi:glycosyltransferase involved in cell wall biosynthesis